MGKTCSGVFTFFVPLLHQLVDSEKKSRWRLIQSTKRSTMFLKVKMYLYDHNHLISRTVTQAKLTKRSINKLQET